MVRADLLDRIPDDVMAVARRLREAGHAVFVVGGALRDLLAGRPPGDWDLATSARPEQMRAVFSGWQVIDVGVRHGTLGVIPLPPAPAPPTVAGARVVQVTTFRVEGPYTDYRHPDYVRFVPELHEDLGRRDFTVNALALDPWSGELHDPWGGHGDIARGLVRAVGDAEARFREDALRPLRAFRLVAQYGWDVDAETSRAIEKCASLVERVARERVRAELERILQGPRVGKALRLMAAHGLLGRLFPCVEVSGLPWDGLDALPPRVEVRLAALLQTPAAAETVVSRWRFPARVGEAVRALVAHRVSEDLLDAPPVRVRRWLGVVGRVLAPDLVAIARLNWGPRADALARRVTEELERGLPVTVEELPVSGLDVMEIVGLPPGPRVGEILRELLETVWADPSLDERQALLQILQRRYGL